MTISVFTRPVGGLLENDIRGNDNAIRVVVNGILDNYLTGPVSSTDNAIVRWDGTTGRAVQNSAVTVDDNGVLTVTSTQTVQQSIRYDASNRLDFEVGSTGIVVIRPTSRIRFPTLVEFLGNTTFSSIIQITSTSNQLQLLYDSTGGNNVVFGVGSGGNLTIGPSGAYYDKNLTIRYRVSIADETGSVSLSDSTALYFPAATTTFSPMRVPHGTAPTSPTNGDVWTTTGGLFCRVNGTTVGFVGGPSSATDNAVARFDGTTGKLVQNSAMLVNDNGQVTIESASGSQLNVLDSSGVGLTISSDSGGQVTVSAAGPTPVVIVSSDARFTSTTTILDAVLFVSGTGRASLRASTTTTASLRIAHGSAPTSPVDGDIWTTTAGLYVQINGSTVGPLS